MVDNAGVRDSPHAATVDGADPSPVAAAALPGGFGSEHFARQGVAPMVRCAQMEAPRVVSAFDAVVAGAAAGLAAGVAAAVAAAVSLGAVAISARNGGTCQSRRAAVAPADWS